MAGAILPSIFVGRYGYLKARAKRRGYSIKGTHAEEYVTPVGVWQIREVHINLFLIGQI
jgi:hypothetical protein